MNAVREITDREEWNALLLARPRPDLRQSWEWTATRGRGWRPLRLAAYRDGRCVAALAVVSRRLPGLGPVAYGARGPVMDLEADEAWAALPGLLAAAAAETRATFLRVSPGVLDERFEVAARLAAAGFRRLPDFWSLWNSPRNVIRLSLEGGERDLLARMARKRRQHISTAAARGIEAGLVEGREALRRFHALLADHAARLRYPVRGWSYLSALHEAFAPGGALALVEGRAGGQAVAALLGVRFGPVAYPLYAPGTREARGLPVGDVVHWEWLRWARAAGCREVDFGSSGTHVPPRETDGNLGIYRFKVELGGRLLLYLGYHDLVLDPLRYRLFRALEAAALPRVRGWLGRLPAGVRQLAARAA